jgi:Ca2+-binding RTX toxin-like protein
MADTVPGSTASTSSVAVGGSVAGTIDTAGDQDWYRVSLTAGRQYRFDLRGLDSGQGTLEDPLLRLLDASGFEIGENDDVDFPLNHDSSITFAVALSGTYFLSAQGYQDESFASLGTFRLGVTDLGAVPSDVPGNTTTGVSVPVGGSVTGLIDVAGDTDWYRVSLVAGHQYRFDLQGASSGQGTLEDPWLFLLDGVGDELDGNDDAADDTLDSSITYVASFSGTYYLSAEPYDLEAGSGTYRLSVTDLGVVGSVDVPGNTNTTSSVAAGGSVTGVIDVPGDTDWFQVALVAGHRYRFDLGGADSGQGTLADPLLELFDGDGVWLALSDDTSESNHDSSLTFIASQSGTYYLSAEPYDLNAGTGSYRLSATDLGSVGSFDVPDDTSTTSTVAVGGSIAGAIDVFGDIDWHRVSLIAGHQYRFDLQGLDSGQGTLADPLLQLFDGAGVWLALSDDISSSNHDSRLTFTASQSGTFYLSAEPYDLDTDPGTYRLSAIDLGNVGSIDVPGNTGSTSTVAVGGSVTGAIGFAGDDDWYRVSLTAGHQYRFDLRGLDSGQGTLEDPLLRLLDGSGLEIDENDDVDFPDNHDSSLTFTASQSGTYFLAAEGYQDPDFASTGTFRLSVADVGGSGASTDTVPADTSTARSVAIGGSLTVTIDVGGDHDWYRVALEAGRQYRFDLRSVDSGGGTGDRDPYLRLLDGESIELAVNDDSGDTLNSSIVYVPTLSGTYFLSAEAYGSSTGTFLLSATDLGSSGPADIPGNTSTASTIVSGGSATGSVEIAGDQDWYRISLTAGREYRFDLQGAPTSQGTLADPQLRLLDGAGAQLAVNDNTGSSLNSTITFTATQTTVHFLSAQGVGANTGTYTLRATDLTGEQGSERPINGTSGDDPLALLTGDSHNNRIFGFEGNDTLDGKGGDDHLDGGAGNDVLAGSEGNDTLAGGPGNDVFADFSGSNVLDGGSGDDVFNVDVSGSTVTGGAGRDRYILSPAFSARDYVVTDFAAGAGGDLLDVRTLLASSASVDAYSVGNSDPFASGVLRWVQSGPDALLQWDKDGAAGALYSPTTQITLRNVAYTSITSDNFVSELAQGNKNDNVLLTGPGNDTLNGLEGNDTLDGSLGRDTMAGGSGADTYYVDSLGDVVQEVPNDQQNLVLVGPAALEDLADTVIAALSYSLESLAYVEHLVLSAIAQAITGGGNALDNAITGNALNNTLTGFAGTDTLDGGEGYDTAVYGGVRTAYAIPGAQPGVATGPDGPDTVSSIERYQFSDRALAFDLDAGEPAGNTVRIIGAAFGDNYITPPFVGIGLDLFDAGMDMLAVCQLALGTPLFLSLAGSSSNADFVTTVYRNVAGVAPSQAELSQFVGLLVGSGGTMTQAQLLEFAANHAVNELNINLVGLAQTGVEYT